MRNFIDEHLTSDEASIEIERAHRIRCKISPRRIIVKLKHLKMYREKRKNIVNQAPDNPTNEDVWKTICVSEYFLERVIRVRSKLYPF